MSARCSADHSVRHDGARVDPRNSPLAQPAPPKRWGFSFRDLGPADPPEINEYDYRAIRKRVEKSQNERQPLALRVLYRLASVRLVHKHFYIRSKRRRARRGDERSPFTPTQTPRGVKSSRLGNVRPKGVTRERAVKPVLDEERFRAIEG